MTIDPDVLIVLDLNRHVRQWSRQLSGECGGETNLPSGHTPWTVDLRATFLILVGRYVQQWP